MTKLVKFCFWLRNRVGVGGGRGEGEGKGEGMEGWEDICAGTGVLIVVVGGVFGQVSEEEMIL